MNRICGVSLTILVLALLGCTRSGKTIRTATKGELGKSFIVIRIFARDCISCFISYQGIKKVVSDLHLEQNTIYLLSGAPAREVEDIFRINLSDSTVGKVILNDDKLFASSGKCVRSSVRIYRGNKCVFEAPFPEYDDSAFRREVNSAFRLQSSQPVMLRRDSTGSFRKHYESDEYALFRNKIFAYSSQFGKIFSYTLPEGKLADSTTVDQLSARLDYLECVEKALADDPLSAALTRRELSAKKNFFSLNPAIPKFTLTNVSTNDTSLCVSLAVTYFIHFRGDSGYSITKRPVLLLLDEHFRLQGIRYFSREKMDEYWFDTYGDLYLDNSTGTCWVHIFNTDDKDKTQYTLGRFSDPDNDGTFGIDSMLHDIPCVAKENNFGYNFLTARFCRTPDSLLYAYVMFPEVHSLYDHRRTDFPSIDLSAISINYKKFKFHFPYRMAGLGVTGNSCVMIFRLENDMNRVYRWTGNGSPLREYALPGGVMHRAFVIGDKIMIIRDQLDYLAIEYYALPA